MSTIKPILFVFSSLVLALAPSCATTKGLGQDLQKVGNRIEQRADSTGGAAPDPGYSAPGAAYGASSNPAAY